MKWGISTAEASARPTRAESAQPAAARLKRCHTPSEFTALYQQAIELLGKSEHEASLVQFFNENFSGLKLKRPARDEWSTNVAELRCGLEFVFARADMTGDKVERIQSEELVLSHVMFSPVMVNGVVKNSPPLVGRWHIGRQEVRSSLGVPSWSSPHLKIDQWGRDGLKLNIDFTREETKIKKLTIGIY